jgi:sulfate adenylyltransferase subunit 2
MLIPADDTVHLKQGEVPEKMWVRFRTLGCMPCTGAVASHATTLEQIAAEMVSAKISERSTRIIDHGANTMEDKKREGYF